MRSVTLFILLLLTTAVFAGNGFGKSPYHNDPHPFRFYYFGYNVVNPGFGFGPELNMSWTKMEKSKCSHGARVSDRQLMFAPQLGMFRNEANTISIFGNLELDYRVTLHGGFTLELFGAGGYAQMLESGDQNVTSDPESSANKSQPGTSVEAKSGFMPQAGLGFGYNFQKMNGRNIPFALNLRTLATTVDVTDLNSVTPGFQAGFTYDF